MAESVTQPGVDQAEGLRTIFGAESSCVVCLASSLDADTTIHLGHGIAHALKNAGHKLYWSMSLVYPSAEPCPAFYTPPATI